LGGANDQEALPKRSLGQGGCLSKTLSILAIQVRSGKVREMIKLWKEKSLIGKFVGIWPREKDLIRLIKSTWNPKGHYDLQLGAKGFFIIIFFNIEDRDRILEAGPYFFFSAGLYLRPWKERFNPETEDMKVALV